MQRVRAALVLMVAWPMAAWAADARFQAIAGADRIAYPGELVVLTAQESTGPGRQPLEHDWIQEDGPLVELSDAGAQRPTFVASQPGVHVFSVRVGRDGDWSAPDEQAVWVVDEAGLDAGCRQGPTGVAWTLPLLALAVRRRVSGAC